MKLVQLILLILFTISVPLTGLAKEPQKNSEPSFAEKWMEGMQAALPAAFCKDKSYFRECFKVTAQECEKEAVRITRICLESKKEDIKANLSKDGGSVWGEKVGECAGQAYDISLKDKRINSQKCNDPKEWL